MCPSRGATYWAIYIINLFTQSTNPRVCFLQFIKDSSHSLSSLLLKRKRQFLIPPLPEKHEMGMHRNQMLVYLLNKKIHISTMPEVLHTSYWSSWVYEYMDATTQNWSPLPGKKAFPLLLFNVSDSLIYPISHLVFPPNTMLPLFHIITKKS